MSGSSCGEMLTLDSEQSTNFSSFSRIVGRWYKITQTGISIKFGSKRKLLLSFGVAKNCVTKHFYMNFKLVKSITFFKSFTKLGTFCSFWLTSCSKRFKMVISSKSRHGQYIGYLKPLDTFVVV